ncbi:ketopantoate reductase family protein [Streptomyces sp. NPDC058045]|uniref:ketopantoate reductase family protein n=1 Tax=Streptomyces sp. NPDC058045 TaxID=3346311 RepID=UPI0036E6342E
MRYVIIGAGAVGATVGGRLAESGHQVVLAARGAHHDALHTSGLHLTTPEGTRTHRLPVVRDPAQLGELRPDDVLLLAVKTQDTVAALDAWGPRPVAGGGAAPARLPLVCAQNGVASERMALRRFHRVYGMCVWLPCTFVEPGAVSAAGAPLTGILHLGRYPRGTDDTARALAADLERSHFAAPVVADVMRWKYAKLLGNLGNAIEAATGPVTPGGAGEALYVRARAEGEAVLTAAGIAWTRSAEERAARGDRITLEPLPGAPRGGGSTWQSLHRGTGTVETDYLNGEIALLGREFGVPTPVNDTLQQTADGLARLHRPAASVPLTTLTEAVDRAVDGTSGRGPEL